MMGWGRVKEWSPIFGWKPGKQEGLENRESAV